MQLWFRPLGLLLVSTPLVVAQTSTASISGMVSDPSGAVVAGASITVTDIARNTKHRGLSNGAGFYTVAELQPGVYQLAAELAGFRRYEVTSISLSTQQKATINVVLELGQVSEKVSVTGEALLLESTSSTLSAVIENKRILDLPLNGRNIYSLTALVPGVFFVRQTTGVADSFTANRFIVNGGQESTSDIMVDGVTATVSHNIANIPAVSAIPSVEGIQEFRIQTNAYTAEYGRSGGGLVTLVTKSGTNSIHGSAFEFLRNSKLDSNDFFANRSGNPLRTFQRNQFGGSVGGPVRLPKIYDGRNRTFFFANYEGQRQRNARFAQHTVPSLLERQGDFSDTRTAQGALRVVYDPFTTTADPARPGRFLRTPFAGNRIPAARIDPVALKAQGFYPQPNAPGTPVTRQFNFTALKSFPEFQDRIEFKIDQNFNAAARMFGRLTYMDSVYSGPRFWGNAAEPAHAGAMNQRLVNAALDYTQTLGASSVLNLRYGLGRVSGNRVPWSTTFSGHDGFRATDLGLPSYIDEVSAHRVFPAFLIQDLTQLGPPFPGGGTYFMGDSTHSMIANVSRFSGRHSLKFGVDGRLNFVNYFQPGNTNGGYEFRRDMTQGPDPRTPSATAGVGHASFLLGTGTAGRMPHPVRPANANRYFAFYAQDDFKVSSRLTINAGSRWDFESSVTERFDRISAIDPTVRNPVSDRAGRDLMGGYLFAGSSLGRRGIRALSPRQVNPRIGFAWNASATTVVRAGYGIFYGLPSYAANSAYTGGAFSSLTPWLATIDGITPHHLLRNPFPDGFVFPRGAADGLASQFGLDLAGGWPESLKPTYNQQWNFTIQRRLAANWVWEVAYAGNKGSLLSLTTQMNQLRPELLGLGDQLLQQVPNPFSGLVSGGVLAQPTVQRGQLLRPFPHYTGVSATNAGYANSIYHALQTRLEKRFSSGFSLLASYTFSKTITDVADGFWNAPASDVRNWFCRSCDRAVSSYDQPHRFVTNVTYELPFGKGKTFGAEWGRAPELLLGNWQINGILTLSQGMPLRFQVPQNTCFCFGGGQKPDTTGVNANLGSARTIDRWFDTAQFRQPAPFTFGNLGRNIGQVRSHGAKVLDFSLFKNWRFREVLEFELRAEAFNVSNTPLFGGPGTTINTPQFGVVNAQENSPRQVQLGLKILF